MVRIETMVTTTNQVYDEIKKFIAAKGEPYSRWYVGVTADVFQSLLVGHGVSQKQGSWIYKQCVSNQSAKNVTMTLMKLGCDGKSGGWDESPDIVYAYLKSPGTTP
jgi:hypothetical protein